MAIGWLTVLKMVPWGDVLENAPKVAQGAKKLWQSVGKKPVLPVPAVPESGTPAPTLALLQAQVVALQAASAETQQQMLECSALIGSLAEQNSQLIARLEVQRKRNLWLALVLLLSTLLMLLMWWLKP